MADTGLFLLLKNVVRNIKDVGVVPIHQLIFQRIVKHKIEQGFDTPLYALRLWYTERIAMVEESAAEADPLLGPYLLRGVTEGLSYDCLKARLALPCSREAYYESYRKFFWLLSDKRQ